MASVLRKVAAVQGSARAVTMTAGRRGYRHWSFAQLQEAADGYAARLEAEGVRAGDRVILMVRPSMEFISLTFALFQLGAVLILIDPGMGYANLLRCIGGVRPDILVGIPRAVLFSRFVPGPFKTLRQRFCVGGGLGPLARRLRPAVATPFPVVKAAPGQLAAIIFTTGSTGPPKGVEYTHGIFHAQLEMIRDYYRIGPDDVDQPGFPLFALFSTALGVRAVIPDMDPSRPAQVQPDKFVRSIVEQGVTYSFGSPAIWNVVSRYCLKQGITLPVRKVLMAGAPVPGELIDRVRRILPDRAEIHTPYGATESLPTTSCTGEEILRSTWAMTGSGAGACVGRPLPGMEIRVIRPVDGPISRMELAEELPPGDIGEIVVRGPVVTQAYFDNAEETRLAKIASDEGLWHRFGDMGYRDDTGRLWFCGRKAHRVLTPTGPMYTVCCEAIFNAHPRVFRSALVGIGAPGQQRPVLLVELMDRQEPAALFKELRALALGNPLTATITDFLVHPGFPVDIRHNAKIFREQLGQWAADRVGSDKEGGR
ncbi:MAG: peptide synthase [Desulfobulbus propionicus]|nr:MAG: peptide synthase [Desulfobulbus propionicus]